MRVSRDQWTGWAIVGPQRLPRILVFTALCVCLATCAAADTCLSAQPYLPSSPEDASEFADLLRIDFQNYLTDIQEYFRCLDVERRRVFGEAQEVSQDYGRFIEMTAVQ